MYIFSTADPRNVISSPPKPNTQVTCDKLTALHNLTRSKCGPVSPHKFKAVYFNKEESSWHADPIGVKVILKAYIVETEAVIEVSPLHLLVINSSRSSLVVPFRAPNRWTHIKFPKPFEVPQNNTNLTITVRINASGETVDMQHANIYLYGNNGTNNCSASNCLDAISNYLSTAANTIKCSKNDSSFL